MLESSIDVQFQAWMAISFAVIVASYSARKDITTVIRVAIVLVYLMAVVALLARWMNEAYRINQIVEVLNSRNVDVAIRFASGEIRSLTYYLGSLITVFAVFYFRRVNTTEG